MTKKILVLNGNPKKSSYGLHLSNIYETAANEQFDIKRIDLSNMQFNPSLDFGFDKEQKMEPCLIDFQQAVSWCEHLVIITPIWWGGIPAKLKGLFDRSFVPGFAFQYETGNPEPLKLLAGKTSRIIMTMDAPSHYATEQASSAITQLDFYTLQFCGFSEAKHDLMGSIISADPELKARWSTLVHNLGLQGI